MSTDAFRADRAAEPDMEARREPRLWSDPKPPVPVGPKDSARSLVRRRSVRRRHNPASGTPLPEVYVLLDDGEIIEAHTVTEQCCHPAIGETIFGYLASDGLVSVHRTDCGQARRLRTQPDRLVELTWAPAGPVDAIQIVALDRVRLLPDLIVTLVGADLLVTNATVRRTPRGLAVARIDVQAGDDSQLGPHLCALRRVPGVCDVRLL